MIAEKVTIRKCRYTPDFKLAREIQACFVRAQSLPELDRAKDQEWWIAVRGLQPAGYTVVQQTAGSSWSAWMLACGVLPEFRGYGLQRRLIRTATNWAKKSDVVTFYTYTINGNNASAGNFIKCGWEICDPAETAGGAWAGVDNVIYWKKDLV